MKRTDDAERLFATPYAAQSAGTVAAHGELTPAQRLKVLMNICEDAGKAGDRLGYGHAPDAADRVSRTPSPCPVALQRAFVELYRIQRNELPGPVTVSWPKVSENGG